MIRTAAPRVFLLAGAMMMLAVPPAGAKEDELGSVKPEQAAKLVAAPVIANVEHSIIHYGDKWYCGHPRQGIFAYFGKGEIVVGHNHAPCEYAQKTDVYHDLGGYQSRSVMYLQRSTDGGKTWPAANDVIVYDETKSTAEKKAFLYPKNARRERYDMFRPESIFFFGRTYLPEDRGVVPVCFALRSPNKGRNWEKVPTIIKHPDGEELHVHKDCHPVVRMPDHKTLLAAMSVGVGPSIGTGNPVIYSSTDNGLTWSYLSTVVASDPTGTGRFTYAGLLLMPSGELQCYYLHIATGDEQVDGIKNAICMSTSKDSGRTWSAPMPIVGRGSGCWKNSGKDGNAYRSPWPILLKDGRVLVLFGRRRMPMGIGGVVSPDGGKTWSEEFVVRDDGRQPDLGYIVGTQLEDGKIFIAYYYTDTKGGPLGGVRYIAGTRFDIR